MYHKGTPADEPHIYPMSKNKTIDGEAKIGGLESNRAWMVLCIPGTDVQCSKGIKTDQFHI